MRLDRRIFGVDIEQATFNFLKHEAPSHYMNLGPHMVMGS